MGRIFSVLIIVGIIGYVLVFVTTHHENSAIAVVQPAAPAPLSTEFSETGTLVFYPNNVGPVPYLFYQGRNGATVARALIFSIPAPTNFSSWSGARISIEGRLDSEHVVVSRITYISGP